MRLSLKDAQTIVDRARTHAETIGVPMNIAVVDAVARRARTGDRNHERRAHSIGRRCAYP